MIKRPGVDGQGGGIGQCAIAAGDRPSACDGRSVDVISPASARTAVDGEGGVAGDVSNGVIELVEGLSGVGLGVAGSDGS